MARLAIALMVLTYLKSLPVDLVKIDGSFVRDMMDDPTDCAMVESIHRVAHTMGLMTVAEFAEPPAILDRLRELGIDYAQGYAIARPGPIEELLRSAA